MEDLQPEEAELKRKELSLAVSLSIFYQIDLLTFSGFTTLDRFKPMSCILTPSTLPPFCH